MLVHMEGCADYELQRNMDHLVRYLPTSPGGGTIRSPGFFLCGIHQVPVAPTAPPSLENSISVDCSVLRQGSMPSGDASPQLPLSCRLRIGGLK